MLVFHNFSVFKIITIFLCSAYLLNAQENTVLKTVSEKLTSYKEKFSPEKVYLQTDKDYYTNGDTLWFKTYILNGISHMQSDKSRVVYVELVNSNQKVIEQRRIYAGFDGGSGDIALVEDIAEGSYFLRAYTKYMLNEREPVFFQKEISIWTYNINSKKNKSKKVSKKKRQRELVENEIVEESAKRPIVQFFPEGGNLVAGLNNVLGLKVTDENGNGVALEGKITNQNGSLIAMLGTYKLGLGRVQFKVEPSTDYFVEIDVDGIIEKYPVPKPEAKGYVLQVNNRGEYLQIRVTTNIVDGLNGASVLGHLRGNKVLEYLAEEKTENTFEIKLSTAELDDGVASFTLFTPNGQPVCERLVFVENPNNSVELSLKTDISKYGFRKKVNIDLAISDQNGIPLKGNFSMSVVTQNGLKTETENIESWLLLNSDLGGTIEDSNYFFEEGSSPGRKNLLDILMLTHGWRRFVWHEIRSDEREAKSNYTPEKGIVINGNTVSSKKRTKPLKSSVRLTITQPSAYEEETLTGSEGKFSFGPMIFRDSIKAVINALNDVDSEKEVAIYLEPSFPNVPFNDSIWTQNQLRKMVVEKAYQEEAILKKTNDFEYDPKVIKLNEFVGREKLKTKKALINEALNTRTMYGRALNRVIPDSIIDSDFYSVLDLIERNVAGVRVDGSYPNQKIRLRPVGSFSGGSPPLYLLDGIAVDPSLVLEMFAGEVLFIDVLKSAGEMALYGSRGRFGVIAVYTDRGKNYEFVQEKELDVANFMIPGFYRSREFYSPNYSLGRPENDKPDYRTMLHWSPDIKVSDMESTTLTFYTGDAPGVYTIRVEGITNNGIPISGLQTFRVEEE